MRRSRALGSVLVLAASLALTAVEPASAATTFTQVSLTATVSGTSVSTAAVVKASATTSVDSIGITIKNATGAVVGDPAHRGSTTISTKGASLSGSLSGLAVGSYTATVWVHKPSAGVRWQAAGASKAFTITPPVTTPTTTPPAAGSWTKAWSDEFDGTALSPKWVALDGYRTNGVTTRASNVTVSGGNLVLTRSDATTGAEVDSARYDGAASGFELQVGLYVEARVYFPGDGTDLANWPAWWTSGPGWPAAGEHDIAEVLGGDLTANYHSPSGSHNQGAPTGYWGDAFHTYGVHRKAASADVYWDGRLVRSYATDDNSSGQALLINVGTGSGPDVYGAAGAVKVDWVRAWSLV